MIRLKTLLQEHQVSQSALARECGLSRSMVVSICNYGLRSPGEHAARPGIEAFLRSKRIAVNGAFEEVAAPRSSAVQPEQQSQQSHHQESEMLRKQVLTQKARQHFQLARDPFGNPQEQADVYVSPSIRYVREAMAEKARHGGLLCVVGESGGGKSTIRELALDAWGRDGQTVAILPYVLSSSPTEATGRPLRITNVLDAIMAALAPSAPQRSSADARMRQVHEALRASARAGHRHVLLIEEAHDLATSTLKALKRVEELKDGLRSLIAVVLVAQPEIGKRLSETNAELRELVQRMEVVHVMPLDTDLEPFLKHRLTRSGSDLARIADQGALDALRTRLTPRGQPSMLYPLAVQNLLTAAMNVTAELGAPKVTAEAVREVVR